MILSYCRVSTGEQASDGTTSLQEQERRNRAIASLRNVGPYEFVNYVDAGVSGAIPLAKRPAGGDMLVAARKGDVIVAGKLDRLFRSASDALTTAEVLRKRGIELVLIDMGVEPVTGTGVAKMFFGMLALVAEFERERIAERMNEGRWAKRKRKGYSGGHAPYGYRAVGRGKTSMLVPDVEEQDIIALATTIYEKHGYKQPYRIANVLNEMGARSRSGGTFQTVQVQRLLEKVMMQ